MLKLGQRLHQLRTTDLNLSKNHPKPTDSSHFNRSSSSFPARALSGCTRRGPSPAPGSCSVPCWCWRPLGSSALSVWAARRVADDDEAVAAGRGGLGSPGPARLPRPPMRPGAGRGAGTGASDSPLLRLRPCTAPVLRTGRSLCPYRSLPPRCRPSRGCPGSRSRTCLAGTGPDWCPRPGAGRGTSVGRSAAAEGRGVGDGVCRSGSRRRRLRTRTGGPRAPAPREPGTVPGQVTAAETQHAETHRNTAG